MRKSILIVLMTLCGLLILSAVAIHIILSTGLPRLITERSLRKTLNTDVSIAQLQTTWQGHSQLMNVTVTLPWQGWFLDIVSIDVLHNRLIAMLTGELKISTLHARHMTLRFDGGVDGTHGLVIPIETADVSIDRASGTAGPNIMHVVIEDSDLGHLASRLLLADHHIVAKAIKGTVFGGTFIAGIEADTQQWDKTQLALAWQDVDLGDLKRWRPNLDTWLGPCSGTLDVGPSQQPHPLEPLAFHGTMDMKGAVFQTLQAGQIRCSGAYGLRRILLTDVTLPLLDGTVQGNASFSRRSDGWSFYANSRFDAIDIHRAANAFATTQDDMAARISGSGYFVVSSAMDDMNGSLNVVLRDSDLAGNQIIGVLYDAMNLRPSHSEPRGYGKASLRFNGTQLNIPEFYYFNRGVEMRGTGIVHHLFHGKSSSVDGIVMAASHPLKDVTAPGVRTLDKLLYFTQRDITSVRVGGTLGDVHVRVVPLPEVQSLLRNLFGSTKETTP